MKRLDFVCPCCSGRSYTKMAYAKIRCDYCDSTFDVSEEEAKREKEQVVTSMCGSSRKMYNICIKANKRYRF